ncbi:alpha/beta fold hydrolase [Vulgatibacter sp.]|uniref:alpha/beta fold hydrolase n=1 Tax=Vulgatibacter sp. TaxID=1971226 RepID=UPI003567BC14
MPSVEVEGRRIHWREQGSGAAMLLLHAFPLDSRMWQQQLDGLSDRYRVIAPDLSGFGASTVPADPAAYSVERWAEEARAVLDACGIERAIVGGCSMGGYVAFAFLRRWPERVAGLLLADSRAGADTPEARKGREQTQAEVRSQGKGPLVERMLGLLLSQRGQGDAALVQRVRALMDQREAGIVGGLEALKNRPDSADLLPGVRVPAVVVVGAEDAITPPALAEEMAAAIPGARLSVLPAAGHLANLEVPEAFDRALDFPQAPR